MAIAITRDEYTASDLRRKASRLKNVAQARRCLAVAAVLDGQSRTAAATAAGMDRQTLCDWVHRYNAEGITGLVDRPRLGRPARMNEAQLGEMDALVETGPDMASDGVVRWRCVDLKVVLSKRFGVELSERSVGRVLRQRGFRRVSARPRHPRSDEAAQEVFKKTLRRL